MEYEIATCCALAMTYEGWRLDYYKFAKRLRRKILRHDALLERQLRMTAWYKILRHDDRGERFNARLCRRLRMTKVEG